MGFPRIISKSNKVYTKLGDFCLSGDGTSFVLICYVCQNELQTQDNFWKHIQDEHNFMQDSKDHARNRANFIEATESSAPLPLYRKVIDEEQRNSSQDTDSQQHQNETKNYEEMRAIEPSEALQMDIKVESPLSQPSLSSSAHTQHATVEAATAAALNAVAAANVTQTLYQLPQIPVSAYATIVHHTTPTILAQPTVNMNAVVPQATAQHQPQELPKDTNSASASTSEDGERWYICDFETCGLKFKYQSRLELHRSVHSKERRFACELCGASFKQSCNLSTHRKKKHFLKGSKSLGQPVQLQQQPQQPQQQRF